MAQVPDDVIDGKPVSPNVAGDRPRLADEAGQLAQTRRFAHLGYSIHTPQTRFLCSATSSVQGLALHREAAHLCLLKLLAHIVGRVLAGEAAKAGTVEGLAVLFEALHEGRECRQ